MSFPRYPEYKPSGVEWLGDVPAHWEMMRLRHCLQRMSSGGTPESGRAEYWSSEEGGEAIPWVSIGDMTRSSTVVATDRSVTRLGLESKQLEVFPVGTLLYSMYASLGKVAQLGVPAAVNQAILALQAEPTSTDRSFLRHWLGFLEPTLGYFASSNTQENLNVAKVRSLPLALPPLPEQRAIAAFLDRETAKIDGLVAEQRRLIELLKEKRQAVISHAVTKGLDPKAPMKPSGVEWLGDVPAHWEVRRLVSDLEFVTSGSRGWAEHYAETGALFLRIGNLTRDSIALDLADVQRVVVPAGSEGERTRVVEGDLLFSITAFLGSVAVVPPALEPAYVSQHVALARLRTGRLAPRWVGFVALSCIGATWFKLQSYGGTKVQLSLDDIRSLPISCPPQEEQVRILSWLDSTLTDLSALGLEAEAAITLLQERRSALISAAVTGQIDVRNAVATEAA